jgi:hypothetical protein
MCERVRDHIDGKTVKKIETAEGISKVVNDISVGDNN